MAKPMDIDKKDPLETYNLRPRKEIQIPVNTIPNDISNSKDLTIQKKPNQSVLPVIPSSTSYTLVSPPCPICNLQTSHECYMSILRPDYLSSKFISHLIWANATQVHCPHCTFSCQHNCPCA